LVGTRLLSGKERTPVTGATDAVLSSGDRAGGGRRRATRSASDPPTPRPTDGEFVVNAKAAQANLPLLHAINGSGAMPRFASGGQAGAVSTPMLGSAASGAAPIQISMGDTHVHTSGGTPAQNQDLAKQFQSQMQDMVQKQITGELRNQMRPGNLLQRVGMR
jgi:hypothetical protein